MYYYNTLYTKSDNVRTSHYTYNHAGDRIVKSHGDLEGVYINGAPQGITFHEHDEFTLYPTSIISVNKNRFTKHYFIGDKRIASRIGSGQFNNVYGRNGSYVTAGQQDYAERMSQIESQKEEYYKELGIPPGVPTMKGAYGDPENTGVGYNSIITELGDHSVPKNWEQFVVKRGPGETPGPPIIWSDPQDPKDAQPGYGYIADDATEEETFFYHTDHLGSTSYITDGNGNITQYTAYLPYGELLVDEHSSSEEMPYKFNGKELDEETGLYYYGARYMQPVASIWYGVDPLTEKYTNVSSYCYTFANPIVYIDLDGRKVIPIRYMSDNKTSYYKSPKQFYDAMVAFGKTTYGHQLLADFTPKGQTIFGVKGNGRYAQYDLIIHEFDYAKVGEQTAALYNGVSLIEGQTQFNTTKGKPQFDVIFNVQRETDDLLETINHEFSIHLSNYAEIIDAYKKTGNVEKAKEVWKSESGSQQHKDILKEKNGKLKGTKYYYKTAKELMKIRPNYEKVHKQRSEYNKKIYK